MKMGSQMQAKSYNVGCVRLTELFLKSNPEKDSEVAEFRKYVKEVMPSIDHGGLEMVAVAGTPTSLASMHLQKSYNPELIDGFQLKKQHVQDLMAKMRKLTIAERKTLVGIDAPRADVIMAGALILEHVMNIANLDTVTVSTRGVRYGLAYKMLEFA
jgi:exopolyphosphatase/guanosine-5'-triphosphate,3'-diphosphate pyrophosphatase